MIQILLMKFLVKMPYSSVWLRHYKQANCTPMGVLTGLGQAYSMQAVKGVDCLKLSCLLPAIDFLLSAVHCPLFTVYCPLFTVNYPLSTGSIL